PEEAAFLHFLVAATGAKKVVEVGTLGGYSGIWIARALPADGRLITLEVDEKHARVASENFEKAGVANKVEVRVGDAHQMLPDLEARGPFDFVFIDANKDGYPAYLEWALSNLELGGVVAAHNAFAFGGKIINEDPIDKSVEIMRRFNQQLAQDPRLVATIFPAGDGMAVAVLTESHKS
ncbi:MAG: O-methyltransferase, partial [Anaerolineales bacterium]